MEGVGGGTEAEAGDRWQVGGEVEGGHGHLLRRRSLAPKKMICSHIPTLSVCPGRRKKVSHKDSCPEQVNLNDRSGTGIPDCIGRKPIQIC